MTASLLLPGEAYTKAPTYSLKEELRTFQWGSKKCPDLNLSYRCEFLSYKDVRHGVGTAKVCTSECCAPQSMCTHQAHTDEAKIRNKNQKNRVFECASCVQLNDAMGSSHATQFVLQSLNFPTPGPDCSYLA